MPIWVILTLLSAFSLATSDALTKRVITHDNEYVIAWFRLVIPLPALGIALLLSGPVPQMDRTYIVSFCAAVPLELGAIFLYYKALRISPLSLTLPFLSVTPVFLILFSLVIVGDPVSPMGAAGIVLIGLGGFTLNLSNLRAGILGPFRAIANERGSLYMLIIALAYSFTSSLGKLAVDHSSAAFFGFTYYLVLALVLMPFMARRSGFARFPALLRENAKAALLPGLFDAVATITHFYAISMTNVAYMIALKRTSLLIGAAYGFFLFGERDVRERMTGAVIMFAGFVVIVLFS